MASTVSATMLAPPRGTIVSGKTQKLLPSRGHNLFEVPMKISLTQRKMASVSATLLAPHRRLGGKVALITGASNGIGKYIAREFTKHGAEVINADIAAPSSGAEDLSTEQIPFIHCDVTKESDVEHAVNSVMEKYGKLDIMINNAAVADPPKLCITDNEVSDFERVISVNLTGVFLGTKHAARVMIPARSGSIINLGSTSCSVGGEISHAYTSSKHAVNGLTKNAAAELGVHGIRINTLSPYLIITPLTEKFFNIDEEGKSGVYSNLTGKYLEPEDVGYAALYLASDESKYVSGHNLAVDGGFTVINPAFGLFKRSH